MTVNERHQLAAQPADTHTMRRTRTYIWHTVNSRSYVQLSSRTAKNKRLWVKGLAGHPHACWISLHLESSVKLPVHTDNHAAHTIYSPFVILTLLQNLKQLGGWGLRIKSQTPFYFKYLLSTSHHIHHIHTFLHALKK